MEGYAVVDVTNNRRIRKYRKGSPGHSAPENLKQCYELQQDRETSKSSKWHKRETTNLPNRQIRILAIEFDCKRNLITKRLAYYYIAGIFRSLII